MSVRITYICNKCQTGKEVFNTEATDSPYSYLPEGWNIVTVITKHFNEPGSPMVSLTSHLCSLCVWETKVKDIQHDKREVWKAKTEQKP